MLERHTRKVLLKMPQRQIWDSDRRQVFEACFLGSFVVLDVFGQGS